MSQQPFEPRGVIPACLLPFNEDLSVDEAAYRSHLRDVLSVRGISAITVNGHASEVTSCNLDEQERVLALTMEEAGERIPVVSGVYSDSSMQAARIARMCERGGASALLVFPPSVFTRGVQQCGEQALVHLRWIAEASSLPLIVFQYPVAGGQGYTLDTLLRMAEEIPSVRAIKDNCGDAALAEHQVRTLGKKLNVLTTHSAWLLQAISIGCAGILSGSGSTVADLQVALWEAMQSKNLAGAQRVAERIYHWTRAVYVAPFNLQHNRMKEAQVLLGRLPRATVRPPLVKISAEEIGRIGAAIQRAGIGREGALELAA